MPLEIYKRRHSPKCLAEIARRAAVGEIAEPADMKQYRACKCAWWIGGINDHGKPIDRHSLKVYSYEAACEEMRKLNQPEARAGSRIAIASATEDWIAEFKNSRPNSQDDDQTVRHYKQTARRLINYSKQSRIAHIEDLQPKHLNLHLSALLNERTKEPLKHATRRQYRAQLNTFLKYCLRMGYIAFNPMERIAPLKRGRKIVSDIDLDLEQATMPLDPDGGDANYRKIIASIIPFLHHELDHNGKNPRGIFCQRSKNFQALLELMYHTGLRISDSVHFEPDKIRTHEGRTFYTTRQIKTKNHVTVFFLPHQLWLVEKVRQLPRLDPQGRFPFLAQREGWKNFIVNEINQVLNRLSEAIGIEGIRCHRFRDSFAVNQLLDGTPMEELQKMLGHKTLATTERYYSPWVPSREKALYNSMLRRQQEKEAGNVIPINHTG